MKRAVRSLNYMRFQMMNAQSNPVMSWDDVEDDQANDDFLGAVEAQEVPKACSLDNPECEACQ
jgi:hypothetical protein